jgi:hypothetical protein
LDTRVLVVVVLATGFLALTTTANAAAAEADEDKNEEDGEMVATHAVVSAELRIGLAGNMDPVGERGGSPSLASGREMGEVLLHALLRALLRGAKGLDVVRARRSLDDLGAEGCHSRLAGGRPAVARLDHAHHDLLAPLAHGLGGAIGPLNA